MTDDSTSITGKDRVGWPALSVGVILLTALSLWLRAGSWSLPALNADEAQYAAHASYLVDAGRGPFETPIGPVHGNGIYHVFAKFFGAYELFPIRVFVGVVQTATAIGIFIVASNAAGGACALVGGAVYCFLALYFEGLSANREWFAVPFAFGGILIYLASLRRSGAGSAALLGLSGLFCGLAALPKDQAVYFSAPVLADVLLRWRADWDWKATMVRAAAYGVGLAGAAAAYVVPFVAAGTFSDHVDFQIEFRVAQYASGGYGSLPTGAKASAILEHLYVMLPFRRLFAAAYIAGLYSVLAACIRPGAGRPDEPVRSDAARVFGLYLAASLAAASTGGRFFLHYMLFVLPPVGVLVAIALRECGEVRLKVAPAWAFWTLALFGFAADAMLLPSMYPRQSLALPMRLAPAVAAGVLAIAGASAALSRSAFLSPTAVRIVPMCVGVLLAGESVKLAAETVRNYRDAVERGMDIQSFPELERRLKSDARPGDRLYVWGWRPEIYLATRLPAATQFATGMEVTLDSVGAPPGDEKASEKYTELLFSDLERQKPRFLVDAWVRSINGAHYRLELYPRIARWIGERYRFVGEFDGCDLYEWSGGGGKNALGSRRERTERAISQLDAAIAKNPHDVTAILTMADLLIQEKKPEQALQWYEKVRVVAPAWPVILERMKAARRRPGSAEAESRP